MKVSSFFRRIASSRSGITQLSAEPGGWGIRLLYEMLILLTIFSEPPEERELRSDLYVLF